MSHKLLADSVMPLEESSLIRALVNQAIPLGQLSLPPDEAVRHKDLGLGFLYYSLARILKPQSIVVLGSYRGFSVICFALGLKQNGYGRVHFIDASKVDDFWIDRERVSEHFNSFGVGQQIIFYNKTFQDSLQYEQPFCAGEPFIDVLMIDGDHRHQAVATDFQGFGGLVRTGGLLCLHDSLAGGVGKTELEVAEFLASLHVELYESLSVDCANGLTIIKKLAASRTSGRAIAEIDQMLQKIERMTTSLAGNEALAKDLNDLKDHCRIAFTTLRHDRRIIEIRHALLTKSREAIRKQLRNLKAEIKRLRS